MNKKILITSIILIIIILGFLVAVIFNKYTLNPYAACTQMGCPCEDSGERPCNTCRVSNPVFMLGIINIVKECSAQEIILCENTQQISKRIDINKNECEYKITFLSLL